MSDINSNKLQFYEFLNGDLALEAFETWVFRSKTLEITLSADDYFDLIEFNFKSHEFRAFVKKLVRKYFDWNEYEKWRTIKLLERIKNGEMELVLATRAMRQLYSEQEEETGKPLISKELALGFESMLDELPIESEYHLYTAELLKKQLEEVETSRSRIMEQVERELNQLLGE